jgi:uncharacterized membrane protein
MSDRPRTVFAFETVSILTIAADLVLASGFSWVDLVWTPLMLWLILSITRRRSRNGRWLFSALYALGLVLLAFFINQGVIQLGSFTWAAWLLMVAGLLQLVLLWSAPTSRWLEPRKDLMFASTI